MLCIRNNILFSVWFAVINLRIAQHFATDPRIPAFPSSGNPTYIASDQMICHDSDPLLILVITKNLRLTWTDLEPRISHLLRN